MDAQPLLGGRLQASLFEGLGRGLGDMALAGAQLGWGFRNRGWP